MYGCAFFGPLCDFNNKARPHIVDLMEALSGQFSFPFVGFPCGHQVSHIPESISHTSGHCGCHAESAMNLDEVVGKVAECHSGGMVLDLFTEGICQASEPANRHAHGQVVPFDIAGVDVLRVGVTRNGVTLATKTNRGTVTLLSAFCDAVDLDQLGVVDISTEGSINGLDVQLQSIASELDAIRQSAGQILDKVPSGNRVALANQPAGDQLGIGIDCGPEPCIACAGVLGCDVFGDGLLFAVAKGPALINLHSFALEVLENSVLVLGAERANLKDQPHHGSFRHAGYAHGGTDGIAFNQATDDLGALFRSEAVHVSIMRYRLRIVKHFADLLLDYFCGCSQEALSLAHRARAAVEAASLRCCPVMLAARRLPPILPPLRPIWAMSSDTTLLVNSGSSGFSAGLSPVSLLTAMIPAWNSSSGSLRERFRIHFQLGTLRRLASSSRKFQVAHYPTSPPATAAACAARQHSSGAGSAERHNAAAPGSRTAAGGPPRAAAAPAAARQQKQRVSAGFSCVFFFWRGLRRTVAFVAGAGAVSVCWRTWQEEQRQATTRAAPVAAPKETGRSTSGNPRSRRPRRHHRSTRRTRESRSPAPAPPPPWLPGRRRTTHWSRTGTGDRRSNTSARDSGNARKSRQTPAGSRCLHRRTAEQAGPGFAATKVTGWERLSPCFSFLGEVCGDPLLPLPGAAPPSVCWRACARGEDRAGQTDQHRMNRGYASNTGDGFFRRPQECRRMSEKWFPGPLPGPFRSAGNF